MRILLTAHAFPPRSSAGAAASQDHVAGRGGPGRALFALLASGGGHEPRVGQAGGLEHRASRHALAPVRRSQLRLSRCGRRPDRAQTGGAPGADTGVRAPVPAERDERSGADGSRVERRLLHQQPAADPLRASRAGTRLPAFRAGSPRTMGLAAQLSRAREDGPTRTPGRESRLHGAAQASRYRGGRRDRAGSRRLRREPRPLDGAGRCCRLRLQPRDRLRHGVLGPARFRLGTSGVWSPCLADA